MISKELYEEVQKDYIDFKNITQDEYITIFNKEEETVEYVNKHTWYEADSISIYKLAHKCKEWATFKNGKNIITERDISGVYSYIIFMIGITIHNEYLDDTTKILANFKADTEPEAIFKACQWILENKYTILTENMYHKNYFAYILNTEHSILENC